MEHLNENQEKLRHFTNLKSDRKEVKAIEQVFSQKIGNLMNEIMNRFSQKEDTTKSLKQFEKTIKHYVQTNSPRRGEEAPLIM